MSDTFMAPPTPQSPLEKDVGVLRGSALQITSNLLRDWERAFNRLWKTYPDGPTAADRLAELGPDAAPLLARSERLVAFILSEIGDDNPELKNRVLSVLSQKPATTSHADGTVTID